MKKIEICIDNYINGNLRDARKTAKNISENKLFTYLTELGWKVNSSRAVSRFLKNKCTFQEACNVEWSERNE